MILIGATLALVLFFFYFNQNRATEKQAYFAIAFMVIYIVVYLYIPPHTNRTFILTSKLYEYIPLVSLGAILLPSLNTKSPENITQFLGWSGLILVSIILSIFKIFVW